MSDYARGEFDRLRREYGAEPKPWPRRGGCLERILTPEFSADWHQGLQTAIRLFEGKALVLCQTCGEPCRAWNFDLDGPHSCQVCKVAGRPPK